MKLVTRFLWPFSAQKPLFCGIILLVLIVGFFEQAVVQKINEVISGIGKEKLSLQTLQIGIAFGVGLLFTKSLLVFLQGILIERAGLAIGTSYIRAVLHDRDKSIDKGAILSIGERLIHIGSYKTGVLNIITALLIFGFLTGAMVISEPVFGPIVLGSLLAILALTGLIRSLLLVVGRRIVQTSSARAALLRRFTLVDETVKAKHAPTLFGNYAIIEAANKRMERMSWYIAMMPRLLIDLLFVCGFLALFLFYGDFDTGMLAVFFVYIFRLLPYITQMSTSFGRIIKFIGTLEYFHKVLGTEIEMPKRYNLGQSITIENDTRRTPNEERSLVVSEKVMVVKETYDPASRVPSFETLANASTVHINSHDGKSKQCLQLGGHPQLLTCFDLTDIELGEEPLSKAEVLNILEFDPKLHSSVSTQIAKSEHQNGIGKRSSDLDLLLAFALAGTTPISLVKTTSNHYEACKDGILDTVLSCRTKRGQFTVLYVTE